MFTPWLCFEFHGCGADALIFARPLRVIAAYAVKDVVPAMQTVQQAVNAGKAAAGYVAYEAAPAFDPAMSVSSHAAPNDFPLLWFGIFDAPQPAPFLPAATLGAFGAWRAQTDLAAYARNVAAIREAIGRGDAYQVNYTLRLQSELRGDAWAAYRGLSQAQGPGYSAYLDLGRWRILSASPELFFHKQGERIVTRPMKGTAPRGATPDEDARHARELAASEKNRAENLMIVDLLRNDLGRVARTGSVRVTSLFDVERYPTVWQMTSTVEAELPAQTPLDALFQALFPCGSVTGAPKISAMQQIARLEDTPRNIYCGAMGYLLPGGAAVFNVAIRTLLLDTRTNQATYGTGGGITWDSEAQSEYAEALAKADVLKSVSAGVSANATVEEPDSADDANGSPLRISPFPMNAFPVPAFSGHAFSAASSRFNPLAALSPDIAAAPDADTPFELLETLRLEEGHYWLLDRHIARMDAAAQRFGYLFSTQTVRARLDKEARIAGEGVWRVRCLADAGGTVRVERHALDADARFPLPVALALRPVNRDNPFLHYKTTRRAVYDACFADVQQAWTNAYDTLLWNREGELTEFTRGNVALEWRGRLITPPLSCGLLDGVLRAELLARGDLREQVVTRDDLANVSNLWLINSVRGWLPVRLLNRPRPAGK